jgi:Domain of unknown function (DUF4209)
MSQINSLQRAYKALEDVEEYVGMDLSRNKICMDGAREAASEGDSDAARLLYCESIVFGAHQSESDDQGDFLTPLAEFDGHKVDDPNSIPGDVLPYFESRLRDAKSPYLRARYADFLWQRGGGHEVARAAIEAHLQIADLESNQGRFHFATDSIRRAASIAGALRDRDLRRSIETSLLSMAHSWLPRGEAAILFIPDLAEAILRHARVAKESLEAFGTVLDEGLQVAVEHRTRRDLLDVRARIFARLGDDEAARSTGGRIGDEWASEAEERASSSQLVAAHFYGSAFEAYSQWGHSERASQMKQLIRSSYQAAESEFGQISQKMTVDLRPWLEEVSGWFESGTVEALTRLACTLWLMPKWDDAAEMATHLRTVAPMSQLISRVSLDEGRPVSQPRSDAEIDESNVRDQYQLQLPLRWIYLSSGLEAMRDSLKLSTDDFISTLLKSRAFSDRDLSIERVGFERYLACDYISALHVLTPRVETALRHLFARAGGTTTGVRKGVMSERSIDQLLEDEDLAKMLDTVPGLHRYLSEVLIQPVGPNLRHKVAHGIIDVEGCDVQTSDAVVHILLLLSLFRTPDDSAAESAS